jgi:hypothetical protein
MHGYDHQIAHYVQKKDFWNAAYAQGYQNGLMFLLLRSEDDRSAKPPFYDVPLDVEFTSLAKISNFPTASIPKPLANQAKRMLKRLPKAAALIPDHTPFL